MRPVLFLAPILVLLLSLLLPWVSDSSAPASGEDGARPRQVAVSADGNTALVTSWGSNALIQFRRIDGVWSRTAIDIGGRSWDVAIFDYNGLEFAIVTLPHEEHVQLLYRLNAGSDFIPLATQPVPALCTAIAIRDAAGTGTDRIFLANRGAAPEPADLGAGETVEEWQQAVYEFTYPGWSLDRVLVCDREPRVLALSPGQDWLYVGHAQGALGGASVDPVTGSDMTPVSAVSVEDYDGGTILAYDLDEADGGAEFQVLVGSPVRGLAIYDIPGSDDYRLYFTHVGHGCQAEDPDFGGDDIPNLIGSLLIEVSGSAHVATERQDAWYDHAPTDEGTDTAVLHEDLLIRPGTPPELWITNSASGSLLRADIDSTDGTLEGDDADSLSLPFLGLDPDLDRSTDVFILKASHMIFGSNRTFAHTRLTGADLVETGTFSSNPRGLALAGDDVLVAGQFSHSVYVIDADSVEVDTVLVAGPTATPVGTHEKNFFTSGRGFDFRESGFQPRLFAPDVLTNNISCGTCHVEGHLDGKVRFIVREANVPNIVGPNKAGTLSAGPGGDIPGGRVKSGKPVQVPTVFDVGFTEWIFSEGRRTIRDRRPTESDGFNDDCDYCSLTGFFPDTKDFTDAVLSPPSPHALQGFLTPSQTRGRILFESMNCSRCHGGSTVGTFFRTDATDADPPGNNDAGPLPLSLRTSNPFLHDPGQSFLAFAPGGDIADSRNVTDVGTRMANEGGIEGRRNGINTPALSNLWDNRPYMHDGRYRTLTAVLDHTWLVETDDYRAASYVPNTTIPDNAFDDPDGLPQGVGDFNPPTSSHPFQVHRGTGTVPGPRISVTAFLDSLGTWDAYPDGDPEEDLLAFLSAVSSQTDPCGPGADATALFAGITATEVAPNTTRLQWTTTVPVACDVVWGPECGSDSTTATAWGTEHEVNLATSTGIYRASITARLRTVCGEALTAEHSWIAGSSIGTVSAPGAVYLCPEGDADTLVISVTLDSTAVADTVSADRLGLCVVDGGEVVVFGDVQADGPAAPPAFQTTISLRTIGGCSAPDSTSFVVVLDGMLPVGTARVVVRSPDSVEPVGVVDANDVAALTAAYGVCSPGGAYDVCYDVNGDGCVNLSDFSTFALHVGDHAPGISESPGHTQGEASLIALTTEASADPRAQERRELVLSGSGDPRAVIVLFDLGGAEPPVWERAGVDGATSLFVPRGDGTALLGAWGWPSGTRDVALGSLTGSGMASLDVVQGHVLDRGALRPVGEFITEPSTRDLRTRLLQNTPNPMRAGTRIGFSLAQEDAVRLAIFDVAGRRIRTLVDEVLPAGEFHIPWDGFNERGERVVPGIYFYRIETGTGTFSRKLIVMR